ncbi:MAG TPA: uracil-DNA glycosylase [Bacteroidia bacterium]|nr:uracil-DNA glycosylase [Bacteroidia bacterium]
MSDQVQIEKSWKNILSGEFQQEYFKEIKSFILHEKSLGKVVYPPGNLIFNAFNLTPFDKVKVVIIGQDPYHGEGQAHGLSFSVPYGVKPPPSLQNIYKEIAQEFGFEMPIHGNLESWALQGVLLLNAILTVNANEPASHKAAGWENFTNAVIHHLSSKKENLVFLLWGKFAQNKDLIIDSRKHLILKAAHPSPFSAYQGFFGCKHFSMTNDFLKSKMLSPIDWSLK